MIRGKPVDQAINILAYTPKKGAALMRKLLESAIANAEHNDGADIDALKVKTICVERGMFPSVSRRAPRGAATASSSTRATSTLRWVTDGSKINPVGFRLAVNRNWSSKWYANSKSFAPMLAEDIKVRAFLKGKLAHASVGRVLIERPGTRASPSSRRARAW